MKELNIKIDFDSIKEYMPEEELREIVKNAIESQINQHYNHDINELVDAVNELQKNATISKMEKVEPADPYAEQRKWIGKLCRFWDTNIGENVWGILGGINFSENEKYPYLCNQLHEVYQNCKPVKPDDDIIYKGGDND